MQMRRPALPADWLSRSGRAATTRCSGVGKVYNGPYIPRSNNFLVPRCLLTPRRVEPVLTWLHARQKKARVNHRPPGNKSEPRRVSFSLVKCAWRPKSPSRVGSSNREAPSHSWPRWHSSPSLASPAVTGPDCRRSAGGARKD